MKVRIEDGCIGCGACESLCEDVFSLDKDETAEVDTNNISGNESGIREAVDACPVSAIIISEEETETLSNQTEINKELNSIQDGDEHQARVLELIRNQELKLEDLDPNLLQIILDDYEFYHSHYKKQEEKIKTLESNKSCHEINMEIRDNKIGQLQRDIETQLNVTREQRIRIEELEEVIDCFKILVRKIGGRY